MAIAFDASSSFDITGSGSGTHTPAGTPRGVVVCIAEDIGTTDVISGVTYGGTAMTRLAYVANDFGNETNSVYIYFLGASIPTGAQTVAVTVASGTTAKRVWTVSFTAAADTESACTPQTFESSSSAASWSVTLPTAAGFAGSVVSAFATGLGNCGNSTLPTGFTQVSCVDFGASTAKAAYDDGLSGANIVVEWTGSANDDVSMAAVAIQEAAGGGGTEHFATVTSPFTTTVGVAGQRTANAALAAPFTFGEVTAAQRTAQIAFALPLTVERAVAGQRNAYAAVTTPLTVTIGTILSSAKRIAATSPFTVSVASAAQRTANVATATPLSVNIGTIGQRQTFVTLAAPLTVTIGTILTNAKFIAATSPFTVSAATAAQRTATVAAAMANTITVGTAAKSNRFATMAAPLTFTFGTSGEVEVPVVVDTATERRMQLEWRLQRRRDFTRSGFRTRR